MNRDHTDGRGDSVLSLGAVGFAHLGALEVGTLVLQLGAELPSLFEGPELQNPQELRASLNDGNAVLIVPSWERERVGDGGIRYGWEWLPPALASVSRGLVGILVPETVLTANSHSNWRKGLFKEWRPRAVVVGLARLPGIHQSFRVALLLAVPRASGEEPITFFKVPDQAVEEVEADFVRALKMKGGETTFGYVLREHPIGGAPLGFEQYDPRIRNAASELEALGDTDPLGDLYTIIRPRPARPGAVEVGSVHWHERVITGRDIMRDGTVALPESSSRRGVSHDGRALVPLEEGDLLIREFQDQRYATGFITAAVRAGDLPAAAGSGVLVLRERSPLEEERRLVLRLLLGSSRAVLIASRLGHSSRVQPEALRELPIPRLDSGVTEAIRDLVESAATMREWQSSAEALLAGAFDSGTIAAARERIVEGGRLIRQRVDAARELDNVDAVIRVRYPYPIAYRWRGLQALATGGDPDRTLRSALECFEAAVTYAAMVGLSLAQHEGMAVAAKSEIRRKLTGRASGVTLGDSIAVLQELTGGAFRRLDPTHPLSYFPPFFDEGSRARAASRRLAERRNDLAHARRPAQRDVDLASEAMTDLRAVLESATFFADLPLVQVLGSRWDAFAGSASVQYRVLAGDHSVVPEKTAHLANPHLDVGSLYLDAGSRGFLLLRPFLLGGECPECQAWSTFHLDRLRDGVPEVKSLEHGHVMEDPRNLAALQQVGLV